MSLRRVQLPFTGFYDNDVYSSGINAQIEELKDAGMSPEEIQSEVDKVDYSSLHKRVTDNYVEIFAGDINDMLPINIEFHDPDYTGNVGYQSVDKLTAVVNLRELPPIDKLHESLINKDIIDFKSALVSIAHSSSGEDDADKMRKLIQNNTDYSLWDTNSLEHLFTALKQAVAISLELVQEHDDWTTAIMTYEEERIIEDCICNGLLMADNLYPPED